MEPLLIRPHFAYVARWSDAVRQFDTPTNAEGLPEQGPLYSAFLERTHPRTILRGIEIADWNHGVLYEVVAERRNGAPVLLRKTVAVYGKDSLTDASQLADGFLAAVAVDYWEHEPEHDTPLREVERTLDSADRPRSSRPSLQRIAAFARDTQANHDAARADLSAPRADLQELVPRHALAKRFHVNVQTADRWLHQAREARLLPPADRGQRRKNSTKGSDR